MFSRVRLLLTISIGLLVLAACGGPVEPDTGFTLTVNVVGDGAVTSDPAGIDTAAGTASADFAENESVTLTATATGAATFVNWTGGACDGSTDASCVVEMTADTEVTANFTTDDPEAEMLPFTVDVNNTETSDGKVTSDVGGIDCPDVCEGEAPEGSQVTLTASVTTGGFVNWTGGDCDGQTGLTCVITVNPDEPMVVANFGDVEQHTETVNASLAVEELFDGGQPSDQYPPGHNYTDSSDLDINWDTTHGSKQWIGLRFDMIELPEGANVQSAVISMTVEAASSDATTVTFSGEAVAAPALFKDDPDNTGSHDASTRAADNGTTETVTWEITEPWSANDTVMSPNLASIVNEIVDLEGWGGSLVFFISPDANAASEATRRIQNTPSGKRPDSVIQLEVTWTTPVTP